MSSLSVPVLTGLVLATHVADAGWAWPSEIIAQTAEPGTTSRALAVQARPLSYRQVDSAERLSARGLKVLGLTFGSSGKNVAHAVLGAMGDGRIHFYALVSPRRHDAFCSNRLR